MSAIKVHPLPPQSLLAAYAGNGDYTDCYTTEIDGQIDLARFVEGFYTTPLFKLERLILRIALRAPSTDVQAQQLARGSIDRFAAWQVEERSPDQLLMRDLFGNTRSWFMVEAIGDTPAPRTRLYFGSAVVSTAMRRPTFRLLLGFHIRYSKALLRAAQRRLRK